ncbi:hypothetical protein N9L68_08660, partial [bacterium]|nr:hypothetical protein [bacterium]
VRDRLDLVLVGCHGGVDWAMRLPALPPRAFAGSALFADAFRQMAGRQKFTPPRLPGFRTRARFDAPVSWADVRSDWIGSEGARAVTALGSLESRAAVVVSQRIWKQDDGLI